MLHVVLVAAPMSCAGPRDQRAALTSKLEAVSLPDTSALEGPVQQQMRDAYASLSAKKEAAGTPPVELARAYGELGNLLFAAAYADAAEPCYIDAQALAPNEIAWPYYLGHVYRTRGDAARAAQWFERARQIQPNDVATLVWLGGARLELGDADAARSLFAQAAALQPRSVAALFGLGRTELARRDYAGAADALERALAADPRATIVHYSLGLAYRGLGQMDKAEAHFRQRGAVEVGPVDPLMRDLGELLHSAVAYENRGIRAMDGGDWMTAAAAFRKGLEVAPTSASLHHKLGTALSLSGDRKGAAGEFQAALRASPDFAQAHYSLGVLAASDGQWPVAIERFGAAVAADPQYLEARGRLADALMRTRRPDLALPHYVRLVESDRTGQARLGYAMALGGLGRFREARLQLRTGMAEHPERPEFTEALARLQAVAPETQSGK